MKKSNRKYNSRNKKVTIFSSILVVMVMMISIGYSSYSQNLTIGDISAQVRIEKNIRVTGVYLLNSTNMALSKGEDYNVKNIYSTITLPNENSSITYRVEITNIGNIEMGILDISTNNENLEAVITSDYKLKDKLCVDGKCKLGIKKYIDIIVKYKDNKFNKENIEYNLSVNFDFRPIYKITYTNFEIDTNQYPQEIIGGDTFKMELTKPFPIGAKPFYSGRETNYKFEKDTLIVENISDDLEIKSNYIQSIEDLVTLSNYVNSGNNYKGITITLDKDLNFQDKNSYRNSERTDFENISGENGITLIKELTSGSGFTPIGLDTNDDNSVYFSGIFDGDSHKINNILIKKDNKVESETNLSYGLFGEIKNSTIKNLTLSGRIEIPDRGSDIVNRGTAGGFAGIAFENNILTNLHNYADVYASSNRDKVAGILGDVATDASATITNCDNYGNIDNSNHTGGIVGINYGTLTITNCNNYGNITNKLGATGMGGIIAVIETSSITTEITNCNNYGTISVENTIAAEQKVGGIVGNVKKPMIMKNCNNSGNIINNINKSTFTFNAGGILGRVTGSTSIIINSHNSGNIIGARRGGGVVGHINTSGTLYLDNTSSSGDVSCYQFSNTDGCGGVLGFVSPGKAYILNSYNTGTITSPGPASGVFGNYASNSSAMIFNSYNIGQINGTISNGIFQNSGSLTVNNVYNAGELLGTTKYGIGNILATSSVSISNSYFDNRVSLASNKEGIGNIKTLNDIKNTFFVNLLNENKNTIDLSDIDSNLYEYTLCNWKLGISGYPELDC